MQKDFDHWNVVKKELDGQNHLPTFNEREIWWCSVGMNVGYEIFGKDERYWRPVLVMDKHNRHTFFGIPLGSARKDDSPYHFPVHFRGRDGSVLLSQARTLSSKRLSNIMGTIPDDTFREIKQAFKNLF